MEYFLLDSKTGELRTAKPLDKEALPDATGLVVLSVRVRFFCLIMTNIFFFNLPLRYLKARELINGVPGHDELTMTSTQASVTIRDVNDSPPTFNSKNYFISLSENTPPGTPLPLDMTVHDPDVVRTYKFLLRFIYLIATQHILK